MDYIEISGKTVDDAITEACQKLEVTSDRLDYEVIEKGSSGFLGFGNKPAVIKARVKQDEPEKKSENKPVEKSVEKPVKAQEKETISEASPEKILMKKMLQRKKRSLIRAER